MAHIFFVAYLFLAVSTGAEEPCADASALMSRTHGGNQELMAGRFDSLFTVLASHHGFNGNVLVSYNGRVLYKNAFGFSDIKRKTPLNIESVFQLASVTKQFTAVAILMLRDQGKLDLGDTVKKYFHDFPYANITIRQLLAHRSGLPNYMYFAGKYWKHKEEYLSNVDVMDMLIRNEPHLEFTPDHRYKYSNTGYAVLASIVAKVSGLSFDTFMNRHVFVPLGMRNTFVFNPANEMKIRFRTVGYNKNRSLAHDDYLSGVVGDKGIFSTVEDMFKWDQALYTERLVKQKTLKEAFTPMSYDRKHGNDYGYGWRIEAVDDGSTVLYHAGWWRGYNALYVRRLEDKTCIVVLSNKINWSFRNIGRLIGIIDSSRFNVTSMGGD